MKFLSNRLTALILSLCVALSLGTVAYQYAKHQGRAEVYDQIYKETIEGYNETRKKADGVARPSGGDAARGVLEQYLGR